MSLTFAYKFPALRGLQAAQPYFVAMCPMKLLPRLFLFDDDELPAELRAQRSLNSARIPEIVDYIVRNRQSYAFSAITASIDGDVYFEAIRLGDESSEVGILNVPMTARFVINDGQHRRAAIEAALLEEPSLGEETIAVVFFQDEGLRRSQQLFADLNKYAVKPTKSLGVLYDHRDPLAHLARRLARTTNLFIGLTEMEKTTISNRSIPLFTLSAIYQATAALLGKDKGEPIQEEDYEKARRYWEALTSVIPEWRLAVERQVRTSELRAQFVHGHGVTLHALGLAGKRLFEECPGQWEERLSSLKTVDWRRTNLDLWEGRAMTGGQMSKSRQNVQRTANLLIQAMGLPLTTQEEELEATAQRKSNRSMKGR
jgi:DNA sulfur modification protein DndB